MPALDAAPDTAALGANRRYAAPNRPLHWCPWREPHPAGGCTGARGDLLTRAMSHWCPLASESAHAARTARRRCAAQGSWVLTRARACSTK
eukprot:5665531-Alexandrium_andersonii.AAC.1